MEILFLGTSAGWPLPRLGCHCQICSSADPRDKRLRPSILVNRSVLIDAGPDFYHQIKNILNTKYCILNTLFITHIHPDHYFGLWDVAKIYKVHPRIFLSEANKKNLVRRINDLTITILLREAPTFDNLGEIKLSENLSVTPFLVDHSTNTETFGFLIKERAKNTSEVTRSGSSEMKGTRRLIYIPDFRQIPDESIKVCQKADVAIWDGSTFHPAGPLRWGHIPIIESIKQAGKLKIKEIYYTHIGHGPKMDTHQNLETKLQKLAGKNFHLAWDGLKLEI